MSAADFKTKMEERQVKLLVTAEQMLTRQIPAPVLPREGPIKCSDCQALLGYMSHVRGYCASHHLILDASLHEKVIAFRDKSFQFDRDGKSSTYVWLVGGLADPIYETAALLVVKKTCMDSQGRPSDANSL